MEDTLVILKPDALERNLVGAVIGRYEDKGLKIKNINFFSTVNKELISIHYPDTMAESLGRKSEKAGEKVQDLKEQGLKILNWNRDYMTRGAVIAIILSGENVVNKVREITGYTDPSKADKGTIRGDLGIDSIINANKEKRSVENLIHASGNNEEAEREIKLWFSGLRGIDND